MEHEPRLFPCDEAIRRIGKGLLACALPRADWTHEAHLAATTYLLLRRPDVDLDAELPGIIRRFNESVGGVNSDCEGYHETITQVSVRGVRRALRRFESGGLSARVNALLLAAEGRREWPLNFFSHELLFSKEARLGWVEPDLKPLPTLA